MIFGHFPSFYSSNIGTRYNRLHKTYLYTLTEHVIVYIYYTVKKPNEQYWLFLFFFHIYCELEYKKKPNYITYAVLGLDRGKLRDRRVQRDIDASLTEAWVRLIFLSGVSLGYWVLDYMTNWRCVCVGRLTNCLNSNYIWK